MNKFFSKRMAEEEEERARRIKEDRERRIAEGRERQRLDAERAANEAKGQKKIAEKRAAKQAAKANGEKRNVTTEAGRVGERPYARGRSFKEDRYDS